MEFSGFIPIQPKSKGRPRFNTISGKAYTPKETRLYERSVKQALYDKYRFDHCIPLGQPVSLILNFYLERPKTVKKQHHTGKPDLDNLVKAFKDAAEKILWANDSQIVNLAAFKHYADKEFKGPGIHYTVGTI